MSATDAAAGRSAQTVSVDVPAGIADGQRIRVGGRGHAGERGGPPGDLYVLVRVSDDSRFVRDGDDLMTAVDVSGAAGRARRDRRGADGRRTRSSSRSRPARSRTRRSWSAARGCRRCAARRHGDLRVVVNVITPRHLDHEQRELLEQLRRLAHTSENLRAEEGVFAKLRRAFGV